MQPLAIVGASLAGLSPVTVVSNAPVPSAPQLGEDIAVPTLNF